MWKDEHSVWYRGDGGTPYRRIPTREMPDALFSLSKTLITQGHSFEEIDNSRVGSMIADTCIREDKIVKMSNSDVKRAKTSLGIDWNENLRSKRFRDFLASFLEQPIKEVVVKTEESEKIVIVEKTGPKKQQKAEKTKEEIMDEILNPKNRIQSDQKIDRSNDLDLELLKELGIEGEQNE